MVIVFVDLEVLGEMQDAAGEEPDLHAGGAGVLTVTSKLFDDLGICGCGHEVIPD